MFIKEAVVNASRKLIPEKEMIKWENNFLLQFLFLTTVKCTLLSLKTTSMVGSIKKTLSSFLNIFKTKQARKRSLSYSIWTKLLSTLGETLVPIIRTTSVLRYGLFNSVQRINNVRGASSFRQTLPQNCSRNFHRLCLYCRIEKICGRRSEYY